MLGELQIQIMHTDTNAFDLDLQIKNIEAKLQNFGLLESEILAAKS